MELTICGPYGMDDAVATFEVHKAGCADLRKRRLRRAQKFNQNHGSERSVVESIYGPEAGSFYEESGLQDDPDAWTHYRHDFHFAPCCERALSREERARPAKQPLPIEPVSYSAPMALSADDLADLGTACELARMVAFMGGDDARAERYRSLAERLG